MLKFDDDIKGLFDEVGVRFEKEGTFIPKDLCIVSLLNLLNTKELSEEQYDLLADLLEELELAFKVCDGAENKEGAD